MVIGAKITNQMKKKVYSNCPKIQTFFFFFLRQRMHYIVDKHHGQKKRTVSSWSIH